MSERERGRGGHARRVMTVAWREFKYTALTRAFLIGAVLFPLVMWSGLPLIIALTKQSVPPLVGTVAMEDPSGEVVAAAQTELALARQGADAGARADEIARLAEQAGDDPAGVVADLAEDPETLAALAGETVALDLAVEAVPPGADADAIKDRVRAGDLLAFVRVDPAVLDAGGREADGAGAARPALELFVSREIKPAHSRRLEATLADAVVRARATRLERDVDQLKALVRRPRVISTALAEGGSESRENAELKEILPIMFMVLLLVSSFTSGQYLLTTTIEEKSNKVMEVLLSAVSPLQLLTGKILAYALVSLVMLVTYGSLGIAALFAFATLDLIEPLQIACFAVYFLIAYFVTAAAMASIGSAVNDMREAQSLMLPAISVLLFLPMLLMFPASQNPMGPIATIFSFVPPVIPYVMIVRITADSIPAWQIVGSMLVGAASVVASLWMAAKIFRVGVLMYGKPPSPMELIRWIRYS